MKLGYSLFLGEYIEAHGVEYKDCEYFQVVCPECREAVFKVQRKGEGNDLHYLSHYKESKSHHTACELRVKAISQVRIDALNSESRDQKLKLFQGVLQTAILNTVWEHANRRAVKDAIRRMQKKRALKGLREAFRNILKTGDVLADFDLHCEVFFKDWGQGETVYAKATQVRIARDFLEHLLSPHARAC